MVKIYLRSIVKDEKEHLVMFDSNGDGDISNGDINNLITKVPSGAKVIWKLDRFSRIKRITKISSKTGAHNVFKSDPRKLLLCKGFKLRVPETKETISEQYNIEYTLNDGKNKKIDPYIRVEPV